MAQQLVHGGRGELRAGPQELQLIGVPQQSQQPVADQVDRGLVSGYEQGHAGREHLLRGEDVAAFLYRTELADQVGGGLRTPAGDQVGEVGQQLGCGVAPGRPLPLGQQQIGVEPAGQRGCAPVDEAVVGRGHAQQFADDRQRQRIGQ